MITPTICQLAVAMAGTSLVLQLASAIAGSRPASTTPSEPDPVVATPEPELSTVTGMPLRPITAGREWSRVNLLKLAQRHGVHTARWRNSARKSALAAALIAAGVRHA